ncbi:MAG: gliding motility-associated protein GldE [Bacteroidota bacterium]
MLLLLASSAFVSSSEVAYFSLTPNDLNKLEQENSPTAQRILELREMPRTLLATILISNNFINIAIVLLSNFILGYLLGPERCEQWASALLTGFWWEAWLTVPQLAAAIDWTITVAGVTFLLVLFGEVAPKVYAKINNVQLAKTMSGVLMFLVRIFRPLSGLLVRGTNAIEKRLSKHRTNGSTTSREDIDQAIELTVRGDRNAPEDIDILKSIVKFGEISAKQIMRARVDVVAVDFRLSFKELLQIVRESGYSRIPVYDEDFDHVTGILYAKDLLAHLEKPDDFEWQALIRTNVMYAPESKKIDDLLGEFQQERMHMAIVVDEYGGSSGIVTLEDIMEEVIGEIRDEFDPAADVDFERIDDYNYVFEGKTLLNDVCRIVGTDTTTFDEVKGDADSVAGLVLEMLGQIPTKGVEVTYNQYRLRSIAVNRRRIEQVQITLPGGKYKAQQSEQKTSVK